MLKSETTQDIKSNITVLSILLALVPVAMYCFFKNVFFNYVFLHQDIQFYEDFASNSFTSFIFGFPILYYCAYKKRGTVWLTSLIVSLYVSLAIEVIIILMLLVGFYGSELNNRLPVIYSFISEIIFNVTYLFLAWRFLLNLKTLRKRNVLFHFRESLKSKEFRKAYATIDSALNYEEASSSYNQLVRSFPQIERFLKKKRDKKKGIMNAG